MPSGSRADLFADERLSLQVAELHRPATVLRPHLPPGAVWPHPQFQGNPGGVSFRQDARERKLLLLKDGFNPRKSKALFFFFFFWGR